ncbi:hypothetical protein FJZ36_10080 [Candidatus Poribacteria bacterium]|nr:hypothetical protein [Candidatus Poribacteria bacterium]
MSSRSSTDPREMRLAYASWIAVCILWGSGFLAIRVGVQTIPPMLFAGLRILAAGGLLTGWLVLRGNRLPPLRDWVPLSLIGLALEGVTNGVLSWAGLWLPSGLLALSLATTPFWMIAIESAQPGGDRLTLRAVLALLIGFGGVLWRVEPQLRGFSLDPRTAIACVLTLLVSASVAAGSVYSRHVRVEASPFMSAGIQQIAAGVVLSFVGTFLGEWTRFRVDAPSAAAFLYLLSAGSIVGFSAYIYALDKLPIALVSLHRYANLIVAVLMGWAILGEPLTYRDGVAVAAMLIGVALMRKPKGATNEIRARD